MAILAAFTSLEPTRDPASSLVIRAMLIVSGAQDRVSADSVSEQARLRSALPPLWLRLWKLDMAASPPLKA
jgi:hypothetical protein